MTRKGTGKAAPRVSVIVPVFNDAARLQLCLKALQAQTFPAADVEILVVDNGSADDPTPSLRDIPNARLLHEPRPGSFAARNRALEVARGDVVAFTDADCLPEPQWLERAVARLQAERHPCLVGGRIAMFAQDADRPTAPELFDLAFELDQEAFIEQHGFAATANLVTWRRLFARVGPFDAARKSQGDLEWAARARAAGHLIVYEPTAVVRHPARRGWRALANKTRRHIGGVDDRLGDAGGARQFVLGGLLALFTPLTSLRLFWTQRNRRLRDRAKLYAANVFVDAVRLAEFARLRLGGKAIR